MSIRVPARFLARAKSGLRRYQRILSDARVRDVGESDTAVIISDFLAEVLGYDKYSEVTTEFAIRSTFCDLAIKIDGQTRFLIEVKSIGTDLKDNHLRQAVDYGAKQGTDWVVLTNGVGWQAHKIRFEKPIDNDLVFSVDLLEPTAKAPDLLEKLFLLSREACQTSDIAKYWAHKEATSKYVIAKLLMEGPVLKTLRRNLRRLSPGLKITEDEIGDLIRVDVLKRELLEGEKAEQAEGILKRAARRRARNKDLKSTAAPARPTTSAGL